MVRHIACCKQWRCLLHTRQGGSKHLMQSCQQTCSTEQIFSLSGRHLTWLRGCGRFVVLNALGFMAVLTNASMITFVGDYDARSHGVTHPSNQAALVDIALVCRRHDEHTL